jgi:hypothetical protein
MGGGIDIVLLQMTMNDIVIVTLIVGILGCGLVYAWLCRRTPGRLLNIGVVTIGLALLAYGHLQWRLRRESPEVKEAMFLRHGIAGWALVGMGYLGLQCAGNRTEGE